MSRTLGAVLAGAAAAVGATVALAPAAVANAQTTTGNVRGVVSGRNGAPVGDVQVAARNVATNQRRGATTGANGAYYLGALPPGTYEVTTRRVGMAPQSRTLQLLVGQTLDVNFTLEEAATQLEAVTVTATPVETRTTEVATNVTQAQVNNLPTPSRNFLDLAQLAPGTRITPDRIDGKGKTFAAGAQAAEQINVFIDGASYKNDIIAGGVAGQDASRGNPFPRNAIQEFRIITNNYKAEYQKASSAIITAATKSGTNSWQGSLFTDVQNENFVALDTFSRASNSPKAQYSRYLVGASGGGPLVQDKLFFFGSYEGNYQNRTGRTLFGGAVSQYPPNVQALDNTTHDAPFREHLGFGKLTYVPNDRRTLEFTGDFRHETDERNFGGQYGDRWRAYSAAENQRNNVYTGRVKDTYAAASWTNEALIAYQHYLWNQDPLDFTTPALVSWGNFWVGGSDATQDLTQNRLSLRDDWTYTGWRWAGTHAIKVGANYDFTRYDMNKQLNENAKYIFDGGNAFAFPTQAQIGFGSPDVKQNNNQFGVYAQDDWAPTRRLTINAGVRWDVETGMFNRDYVTPQAVRDSITASRSSLLVDVDPSRYFTDGNDRKLFLGAVQPRIGASYALDHDARTVAFGSFGIFYDRLNYNATLDETYRRQHPNYTVNFSATGAPGTVQWDPKYYDRSQLLTLIANISPPQEVFLIPNDLEPPRSNQWSLGLRHDFQIFNASVTYNGTRSYNGFSFEWANVALDPAKDDCCISSNVPAYQNVLVGNNSVHTWYDALLVQIDRPYRRTSNNWGWGAGLAYTLAKAEAEGGDLFSFPQVTAGPLNKRHPIADDRRHQVVANWITDAPYLWGIQFSGIAQFATGTPINKLKFVPLPVPPGGSQRILVGRGRGDWFQNVDIRFRKDFVNISGNRAGVTLSVFNLFNSDNFKSFEETYLRPTNPPVPGVTETNPGWGKASDVLTDPRRIQLGLTYDFY